VENDLSAGYISALSEDVLLIMQSVTTSTCQPKYMKYLPTGKTAKGINPASGQYQVK